MMGHAMDSGMPAIPQSVLVRLDVGETVLASTHGAQGSGMAVTDQRVVRWRPPGAVVSLSLAMVERIHLDPARPDGRAMLLVTARDARPPLTLSLEPRHMAAAGGFTTSVLRAVTEVVGSMRADPVRGGDPSGRPSRQA